MNEIEKWLETPDYQAGIELYRKLGGNDPTMLSIFSLSETSFTRSKLEEALKSLLPEPKEKEAKEEKTPKPVVDLIRERSQLHELAFNTKSKSDRHKIAVRILSITKILDRWYDHGQLPDAQAENKLPEQDIPSNAWDLHMMINNNAAYITKNKKREDKKGEVMRRERQNSAIEERLKSINYETSGQST